MAEFTLPDLGEGLQDAEILEWHIMEGESIQVDQLVLVVETAKAVVEIPSPVDATVSKIHVKVGDTVDVDAVLFSYTVQMDQVEIDSGSGDGRASTTQNAPEQVAEQVVEQISEQSVSVVGRLPDSVSSGQQAYEGAVMTMPVDAPAKPHSVDRLRSLESPPALMSLAKTLGLESRLAEHPYGDLTESDLVRLYEDSHRTGASGAVTGLEARDHIIKLSGARKVMAQTMTKSHQHIPSVTLFDDGDISHWDQGTDITLRVINALIAATRQVPLMNAWFDEEALSVQLFEDVHLGVAVNSNDGLFVPVIRQAQSLAPERLRQILNKQIQQVSDRTIKPQAMLGATISLSNFGTLSGRYATPIIVPPQVAIVGIGKIRSEPVVREGQVAVGRVMPLSLSFDHRAASGSDAASFMSALIQCLST